MTVDRASNVLKLHDAPKFSAMVMFKIMKTIFITETIVSYITFINKFNPQLMLKTEKGHRY